MKIYISGKISGLPIKNVIEKFKWHAGFLEMKGHEPVNPIDVSPFDETKDWSDYMVDDIAALLKCEAIYDRNMPSCGIRPKFGKLSNYIATWGIFMCYVALFLSYYSSKNKTKCLTKQNSKKFQKKCKI